MALSFVVQNVPRRLGMDVASETQVQIKRLPKKKSKGPWHRSVESRVVGNRAEVYYNLQTAVYARMRERGGVIVPFRAKFLFVPLRPDVRPNQPGLVFGRDFVLSKRVVQKGTHVMELTASEELLHEGSKTMRGLLGSLKTAWDTGGTRGNSR
jgi:hypothetical protein